MKMRGLRDPESHPDHEDSLELPDRKMELPMGLTTLMESSATIRSIIHAMARYQQLARPFTVADALRIVDTQPIEGLRLLKSLIDSGHVIRSFEEGYFRLKPRYVVRS